MASKLYGCFGAGDGLWDKLIRFVERSVEHDRYTPQPVATHCYS